jgi:hypothetical protein
MGCLQPIIGSNKSSTSSKYFYFSPFVLPLFPVHLKTTEIVVGIYYRNHQAIGPASNYILAQRPILLGYKYSLLIILLTLSLLLLAVAIVPSSSSSI